MNSSLTLVAQLNDRWRVVEDPLQWIIQVRKGQNGNRTTGWQSRHFFVFQTALRRAIDEYCGDVDPAAMTIIDGRPPRVHAREARPSSAGRSA